MPHFDSNQTRYHLGNSYSYSHVCRLKIGWGHQSCNTICIFCFITEWLGRPILDIDSLQWFIDFIGLVIHLVEVTDELICSHVKDLLYPKTYHHNRCTVQNYNYVNVMSGDVCTFLFLHLCSVRITLMQHVKVHINTDAYKLEYAQLSHIIWGEFTNKLPGSKM